ncbi:Acetate kinase [Ceratocystis lukuohia]|uniref:Probable acetate kinase n=1 Tax=Ceratocystis lukuohia TaxID=2019550 RepID=A0ABR4MKB5_9PEZI
MVSKIILAVNAGSSSVKASVFKGVQNSKPKLLGEAQVSGLTAPPASASFMEGGEKKDLDCPKISSQDEAFAYILKVLTESKELSEINTTSDINVVTHRIVHGGDYAAPEVIGMSTFRRLEELTELAPLHNGPALSIVRSCAKQLPTATNVACFDSQFHSTLPEHVRTYPIDLKVAGKNQLRKYGFHGLSYSFIVRSVAAHLSKPSEDVNIIALHLGSGASACAIRGGHSVDTSMGLTPLAGLPGATRSGSVDPSLVFHYASNVGRLAPQATQELHISRAEEILNKEAGWKALTGTTDFGRIAASESAECKLAFAMFVDRIAGFVGSYFVALGGEVDALVFAGGIGERSAKLRKAVGNAVECLGFEIDNTRNEGVKGVAGGEVVSVGRDTARKGLLVCGTDEQQEMATLCAEMEELW